MAKTKSISVKMTIGPVRFSYLHVNEPASMPGSNVLKFSASLIFSKTTPEGKAILAQLEAGITEILQRTEKLVDKTGKKLDRQYVAMPVNDGDAPNRAGDGAYEGAFYINAKSTDKPALFDQKRQPIMDATQMYSGAWGYASISLFDYDTAGKFGIAVGLNGLQKSKDDTPLAGRGATADDFKVIEDDSEI